MEDVREAIEAIDAEAGMPKAMRRMDKPNAYLNEAIFRAEMLVAHGVILREVFEGHVRHADELPDAGMKVPTPLSRHRFEDDNLMAGGTVRANDSGDRAMRNRASRSKIGPNLNGRKATNDTWPRSETGVASIERIENAVDQTDHGCSQAAQSG